MERYEFGSRVWLARIHELVRELLSGVDLTGIDYSSSEEYLDPPAHLARPGGLGWHMIVRDGQLILGEGPLRDAQRAITADYSVVAPLASVVYRDNPDGEALVRAAAQKAAAQGLLSARGDKPPSAVLPQLAALHDRVAEMTVPAG
jgi:hypothetical protein